MEEVITRRRSIGGLARILARHPKAAAGVALSVVVVGLGTWWMTQLWGLPDVGDPFDVAAFEAVPIPDDDRNAFAVYRQATSMSDQITRAFRVKHPGLATVESPLEWAKADQPWRDFLTDHQEALALWRVGTERPDARNIHPGGLTFHTIIQLTQNLRVMTRLAVLEASRLEAEGDMAGAWSWYRSALRSSRHTGRHGFLLERTIGAAMHSDVSKPLTHWAEDPRVDAALLRRVLDEVIAIDATTAPISEALKVEYLVFVNSLHDPSLIEDLLIVKSDGDPADWCQELPVSNAVKQPIQAARVVLADDRERSLRIVRLMVANWLAQLDRPPSRRPKLGHLDPAIYEADPTAPPASRALPPEKLASWLESSLLARRIYTFQSFFAPAVDRERARQARLVVHLASELYRREHGGAAPPSPRDLVGPYLMSLPEWYDSVEKPARIQQ